jgi:paraquat-inducible protein B
MSKVVIHDLRDIVNRKILVNKMNIEYLNMQDKLCNKIKVLQDYAIDANRDKITHLTEINEKFEGQLRQFDQKTQDEILQMYDRLNKTNIPPKEQIELMRSIDELDHQMRSLAVKIEALERTIPELANGEQYIIKQPAGLGCASDV